jgi:hypothetical protein
MTILRGWDTEKVTLFAPDTAAAKAGKKLARPDKWLVLGCDDYSAWGEYEGSGSSPYQVKIDLLRLQKGETAHHCTCPSHKQPCKHTLGLLFVLVEQPDALKVGQAPAFVQEWLDKAAQRARKQQEKKKRGDLRPADPEQQAKTLAARQQAIADGLAELERWLIHLIRHGLADPQLKDYTVWEAKAARMVDAQAPGLANWLRNLAGISSQGSNWVEPLLDQLSRIYLLIQGFKRFEQLPVESQADLRTVLGWHQKREEAPEGQTVADEWLVLGRQEADLDNRLRSQRLWLRGRESGCDALLLEFAYGDAPFETYLLPGWSLTAELCFFPSRFPLRAFIQRQQALVPTAPSLPGSSISASITAYSRALAQNPWLLQFPFFLEAVIPTRYSGSWIVREAGGAYLPIARGFKHKWSLLALSGGSPLQLAGEWDGQAILPTGAVVGGRFIDFNQIGAI